MYFILVNSSFVMLLVFAGEALLLVLCIQFALLAGFLDDTLGICFTLGLLVLLAAESCLLVVLLISSE